MRILSGALPETDAFLHVGYLSAYPRPFRLENATQAQSLLLKGTPIDVAAALRLKDDAPAPESAATQVQSAGAIWMPNALSQTVAGFLIAFVLGVLALYAAKSRRSFGGRLLMASVAIACAVLGLASFFVSITPSGLTLSAGHNELALPPPDTKPPWEGMTTRAYADPESATRVLMHGIVGDALANAGRTVLTLAQLKDEVGLPTAHLTAGESYALQTYGLDGWGHPFRLEGRNLGIVDKSAFFSRPGRSVGGSYFGLDSQTPRYNLTSAGPDGTFETPDDLHATIKACIETNWDDGSRGLYLHRSGDSFVTLFHRWRGITFTYANKEQARRLTGGSLYDMAQLGTRYDWIDDPSQSPDTPRNAVEAAQRIYTRLGFDAEHGGLVLLISQAETTRL